MFLVDEEDWPAFSGNGKILDQGLASSQYATWHEPLECLQTRLQSLENRHVSHFNAARISQVGHGKQDVLGDVKHCNLL